MYLPARCVWVQWSVLTNQKQCIALRPFPFGYKKKKGFNSHVQKEKVSSELPLHLFFFVHFHFHFWSGSPDSLFLYIWVVSIGDLRLLLFHCLEERICPFLTDSELTPWREGFFKEGKGNNHGHIYISSFLPSISFGMVARKNSDARTDHFLEKAKKKKKK